MGQQSSPNCLLSGLWERRCLGSDSEQALSARDTHCLVGGAYCISLSSTPLYVVRTLPWSALHPMCLPFLSGSISEEIMLGKTRDQGWLDSRPPGNPSMGFWLWYPTLFLLMQSALPTLGWNTSPQHTAAFLSVLASYYKVLSSTPSWNSWSLIISGISVSHVPSLGVSFLLLKLETTHSEKRERNSLMLLPVSNSVRKAEAELQSKIWWLILVIWVPKVSHVSTYNLL